MFVCLQKTPNGFQNRCLRKIIGVKPSFISRISNASVLQRTHHTLSSTQLLKRQLQLFGKVIRSPESHPLRQISFTPGTELPLTSRYIRRKGRPAKEWIPEMVRHSTALFGTFADAKQQALDKAAWNNHLRRLVC